MFKEFKEFALRGNVMDMAIGIVIGTAFGKIVSSFVADVIMPPIGVLMGNVDFSNMAFVLQEKTAEHEAVTVNYGMFLNTLIDFVIIAFAIFIVVKQINRFTPKAPVADDTKTCPECCSTIPKEAKRCCHCTAQL